MNTLRRKRPRALGMSRLTLVACATLSACAPDELPDGAGPVLAPGLQPGAVDGSGAPQCTSAPQGRSYLDFGGLKLEQSRANQDISANRARVKPFSVLAAEYKRIVGITPPSLAGQSGAFEPPPARWYEEPSASGVGMTTLYGVGFEAGLSYAASDARFKKVPDGVSAPAECAAFLRRATSRTPASEEISTCVAFALKGVTKEPVAERRWAYVFASVLTSTGFLSY
jgi:hypothetical protein